MGWRIACKENQTQKDIFVASFIVLKVETLV